VGCGAAVANFDTDFGNLADYASGGTGNIGPDIPVFDIDYRQIASIPKILAYMKKHGGNPRAPLKRFNVYMIGQTDKTFQQGGRSNVRWQPLAPITVIMRKYRGRGSGRTHPKRILHDSGHLKNATNEQVIQHGESLASRIFNDVPYAKTHQFGGTISIPERTIEAKKKKFLHFFIAGHEVFKKSVTIPAYTKPVPARPFLFFLERDKDRAVEILLDYAEKVSGQAVDQGAL